MALEVIDIPTVPDTQENLVLFGVFNVHSKLIIAQSCGFFNCQYIELFYTDL